MPARNPERDAFISLSEGYYISIHHFLRIFADMVRRSQKKLDRRQLYLAQKLLNSTNRGLFGQLFDLLTFRRYKIEELSIEFAIIREESGSVPDAPMRFRLVYGEMQHEYVQQASIKVLGNDQILAEFRINGELTASVVSFELK